MKKNKNIIFYDIEKAFLQNISRVSIYIILILISTKITTFFLKISFIDITSLITIIWAIIAFWYSYKKYERDKELYLIEKFTKEYDDIKSDNKKLLDLWQKEYFLHRKGYISNDLWEEWHFWIKEKIITDIIHNSKKWDCILDVFQKKYKIYHYNKWEKASFPNYIIGIIKGFMKKNQEVIKRIELENYLNKKITSLENTWRRKKNKTLKK